MRTLKLRRKKRTRGGMFRPKAQATPEVITFINDVLVEGNTTSLQKI